MGGLPGEANRKPGEILCDSESFAAFGTAWIRHAAKVLSPAFTAVEVAMTSSHPG